MRSIADDGRLSSVKKKRKKRKKSRAHAVKANVVSDLELIFPQDLKMWAKSAGRKFLEAQDKLKVLSSKGISASAYWDNDHNIVVLSEDNVIRETYG